MGADKVLDGSQTDVVLQQKGLAAAFLDRKGKSTTNMGRADLWLLQVGRYWQYCCINCVARALDHTIHWLLRIGLALNSLISACM